MPITGLIVAHNEQELIEDALKSLSFCEQIVVVLDNCSDNTKAIASQYTDQLIEGNWEIEGERRAVGINACLDGNWIVELDADERIAPPLATEIKDFVATNPTAGYALLPVQNYVGKRYVAHGWAGSFGTTKAKKLFYKGCKVWGNQRAHGSLTLSGKAYELGQTLSAGNGLVHLVDKDINDMIDRLKNYSDALAKDMVDSNKIPKFSKTLRKAFTRFYKSYFARKGYKEGAFGFLLATMPFMMFILAHLKAQEIKNEK